jgi:hypothetical protein
MRGVLKGLLMTLSAIFLVGCNAETLPSLDTGNLIESRSSGIGPKEADTNRINSNAYELKPSEENWCHSGKGICERAPAQMKERAGGTLSSIIKKILSTNSYLGFSLGQSFDGRLESSGKPRNCNGIVRQRYVIEESPDQSLYIVAYSGIVREIGQLERVRDVPRDLGDYGPYKGEELRVYVDLPNRLAAKLGEPKRRVYIPSKEPEAWRFDKEFPQLFEEFILDYRPSTPTQSVVVRAGAASTSYSIVLQDTTYLKKFNDSLQQCDANSAKAADKFVGGLLGAAVVAGAKALLTCDGKPCAKLQGNNLMCETTCHYEDGSNMNQSAIVEVSKYDDITESSARRALNQKCSSRIGFLTAYNGSPSAINCSPM